MQFINSYGKVASCYCHGQFKGEYEEFFALLQRVKEGMSEEYLLESTAAFYFSKELKLHTVRSAMCLSEYVHA